MLPPPPRLRRYMTLPKNRAAVKLDIENLAPPRAFWQKWGGILAHGWRWQHSIWMFIGSARRPPEAQRFPWNGGALLIGGFLRFWGSVLMVNAR